MNKVLLVYILAYSLRYIVRSNGNLVKPVILDGDDEPFKTKLTVAR